MISRVSKCRKAAGKPGRLPAPLISGRFTSAAIALRQGLMLVSFVLFMAIAPPSASEPEGTKDLEAAVSDLNETLARLEVEYPATSTELGYRQYEAYLQSGIPHVSIEAIEDPDLLGRLFDVTRTVAFYHPQSEVMADRLVDLLLRMDSIGTAGDDRYRKAYWAAFKARRFDRANQVAHLGSNGSNTPQLAFESSVEADARAARTVLLAGDEGRRFERHAYESSEAVEIVVLFDPFCGPSRNLLSQLASDPSASRAFSRSGMLLIPQYVSLEGKFLFELQQSLPFDIGLMYDYSEWDSIESMFTPTMYVFEEGMLAHRIVGDQAEMLRVLKSS
jgi:hypothetical protein